MCSNMLYKISLEKHTEKELLEILTNYPEIKFVSLMGVDLYGNGTEEKIPIKMFLNNINDFLYGIAVQTDGSSVALPGIATLNDAKIDMMVDKEADWFVDYNRNLFDEETNKPIGTLIIPSFSILLTIKPISSACANTKTFLAFFLPLFLQTTILPKLS